MRVSVEEEGCISCGLCVETCPEVFAMNDKAHVIADPVPEDAEDSCTQAAEECPVSVITIED